MTEHIPGIVDPFVELEVSETGVRAAFTFLAWVIAVAALFAAPALVLALWLWVL